jgi:hypothetical protein
LAIVSSRNEQFVVTATTQYEFKPAMAVDRFPAAAAAATTTNFESFYCKLISHTSIFTYKATRPSPKIHLQFCHFKTI